MNQKNVILASDPREERILRRIPWEVFGVSSLLAVCASLVFDISTGLFVLGGGILSAINFAWLRQALSSVLLLEKKRALKASALVFMLRLILILGIFFIIIFFFSKKGIAFAAGFSVIIVVFLIEAGLAISRMKKWKN
jgi:hypothetical protein